MAIVVAVAGAADVIEGGLWHILEQAPDLEIMREYPHFGIVPDVVLYDVVEMQQDGGAHLAELIDDHESAVIVVGRDLRPDLAARALARGAAGCVSAEAPAAQILEVVRAAATHGLEAMDLTPSPLGAEAKLSPREVSILGDIVSGLSNQDMAERHSLSLNTVKTYVRGCYHKIGVSNRSQAVCWGLQHGFAPDEPDQPDEQDEQGSLQGPL